MKTFKFKFYESKKNRELKRTVNVAAVIYNYCIAVHKRYYRLTGKYLHPNRLKKNIAARRNRIGWWKIVGSQAVQDIVERIDKAYQLFFKFHARGVRPPSFKKVKKYSSFTLKQNCGFKFLDGNRIKIGKKIFKFHKSREIEGKIKTVTIKRDKAGDMFLAVVTDKVDSKLIPMSGKAAGFDFGLKTFLVDHNGKEIVSPLFFKSGSREIAKLSKILSQKVLGSNQWNKARIALAKAHRKIANQRRDWFWKLAHQLTDEYDYLFFEDLNLKGMVRLWGRKVSDLSFRTFLTILETVAKGKGKIVHYIDRWYPSSKTCSCCDHKLEKLDLSVRRWRCPSCGTINDRDHNAAKNIRRVGASTLNLTFQENDLEIIRLIA
jgi:putative transposase